MDDHKPYTIFGPWHTYCHPCHTKVYMLKDKVRHLHPSMSSYVSWRITQQVGLTSCIYCLLSVISTYGPIYGMYHPIEITSYNSSMATTVLYICSLPCPKKKQPPAQAMNKAKRQGHGKEGRPPATRRQHVVRWVLESWTSYTKLGKRPWFLRGIFSVNCGYRMNAIWSDINFHN